MKKPIQLVDAKANGWMPLTHVYTPEQKWMMERVVQQLGRRDYMLVIENAAMPQDLAVYTRSRIQ